MLTLHPNSYDWRFVPEAGKSFTDSGSDAVSRPRRPRPAARPGAQPSADGERPQIEAARPAGRELHDRRHAG